MYPPRFPASFESKITACGIIRGSVSNDINVVVLRYLPAVI